VSIKAPFPWFGGKSAIACEVWRRFGKVQNYVEPFAGSAAMLLGRPGGAQGIETINDADGLLSNFWRALSHDPHGVAHHADWPVNEADLHARHLWLIGHRDRITERLMGDPDWFDVQAAGWWVWGCCAWIGSGWCSGRGPWMSVDGVLTHRDEVGSDEPGVNRQLPHLGNAGRGVHRGNAVWPNLEAVAGRLRGVRVACGDWQRVLGACLQPCGGKREAINRGYVTAVFLDPPYGEGFDGAYAATGGLIEDASIAADVWRWAVERGDDPTLRIAVAGYDDGRDVPDGWSAWRWQAAGGYGRSGGAGNVNHTRETVWFSPHCLAGEAQLGLFGAAS
jgi:DNA adenine methylase